MKKFSSNKTAVLTPRQQKILDDYIDNLQGIRKYDGFTTEEIERFLKEGIDINEIYKDYQKALFKAIRADLHTHPLVPTEVKTILTEWIATYQALGVKKLLRDAKRGLEVGVKRTLSMKQVKLINAARKLRLQEMEIATPPDMDDDDASTLAEIFKEIQLTRIYDPDNPPSQSKEPVSWTAVYRFLVKRGIVKTERQVFLRKIERLSPGLFPRRKKPKKHSEK
jgi:hypothetical protein